MAVKIAQKFVERIRVICRMEDVEPEQGGPHHIYEENSYRAGHLVCIPDSIHNVLRLSGVTDEIEVG